MAQCKLTFFIFFIAIACSNPQAEKERIASDSLRRAKQDSIKNASDSIASALLRPWSHESFQDDFGDVTQEKYMVAFGLGTFSNSATKDSDLFVKLIVTKKSIGLFLHEYSISNPAVGVIQNMKVSLKNSTGEILQTASYNNWNQGGGCVLSPTDYKKIVKYLEASNGVIKFAVKDTYSSSYSFTIDVTGFAEDYDKL